MSALVNFRSRNPDHVLGYAAQLAPTSEVNLASAAQAQLTAGEVLSSKLDKVGNAGLAKLRFLDGGYERGLEDWGREKLSVFDAIPDQYHDAIRGRTYLGDVTGWIEDCLATGRPVELPPGDLRITRQLIVQDGQTLVGSGTGATRLRIDAGFDFDAYSVIRVLGFDTVNNDFSVFKGGTTVGHFAMYFDQSHVAVRGDLLDYPWALDMRYAMRMEIPRLRIAGATKGIDGSQQASGLHFGLLEVGCFNQGIRFGNSGDCIIGGHIHLWPYDIGNGGVPNWQTQYKIYGDGVATGLEIGRADGLSIAAVTAIEQRIELLLGGAAGAAKQIGRIQLDGNYARLVSNAPNFQCPWISSTKNMLDPLVGQFPSIDIQNGRHMFGTVRLWGTNNTASDMLVRGGEVSIGVAEFEGLSTSQRMFEATGGRSYIHSGYVKPGVTSVRPAPMIHKSGPAILGVTNLKAEGRGAGGSGTLIKIDNDQAGDIIANVQFWGWNYELPAGAKLGTYGPNGIEPFEWLPTLTFATPGDIASKVTYTPDARKGYYWYEANGIRGTFVCAGSVGAYAGASGNLLIDGLPVSFSGVYPTSGLPEVNLQPTARLTLTAGYTSVAGALGGTAIELRQSGSGQNIAPATTLNLPPGTNGFYFSGNFFIPTRGPRPA